jgi:ATP-dependent Clp protease ATP-binding subunit ClpA
MLNKDLEISLNLAFRQAKESRHEFMTVEHLLLALLDNPSAIEVLGACGTDVNIIKTSLL